MILNLIRTSVRYLLKNRSYLFINLLGLVIGIITSLFIFLFVQDELSYDRFHKNHDNIYRVEPIIIEGGEEDCWAATQSAAYIYFRNRYPEIVTSTRLYDWFLPMIMDAGNNLKFSENQFFFADSTFFDIFSFRAVEGDLSTALKAPESIVITETTAKRYFGDQPALGKILKNDTVLYRVSAVIEDVPSNSHFHFDLLAPIAAVNRLFPNFDRARNLGIYSYLLVENDAAAARLEEKLNNDAFEIFGSSREESDGTFDLKFRLMPVSKIHLGGKSEKEIEPNGDKALVYIFSIIGMLVLALAIFNYTNLATAQSFNRAREVGVRKITGAYRWHIFSQFMGESFIIVSLAILFSIIVSLLLLPFFNDFTGKQLTLNPFVNLPLFLYLLSVLLLVGFLAGSYPSLFLARFNPIRIVKSGGGSGTGNNPALGLRRVLVVFQFAISVALIIGSIIVFGQLRFIRNRDTGFDKTNVIFISLPNRDAMQSTDLLTDEIGKLKNVIAAGASFEVPGDRIQVLGVSIPSLNSTADVDDSGNDNLSIRTSHADEGLFRTMGFRMAEGRWFSDQFPSDRQGNVILNETAVRELGLQSPVIGTRILRRAFNPPREGTVVGVVKDYNYASVHSEVEPLMIAMSEFYRFLCVRIGSDSHESTINEIRNKWDELLPGVPFDYRFLEERYDELYRSESNMGSIMSLFTLLAIIVSALGLFGLASYISEKRTMEVGVRKVFGASVNSVLTLLGREFVILVILANAIAWFPAWFFMKRWLEGFAFRTSIGISVFVVTALLSLILALATISYRTYRAAVINPARALKYE